MKLFDWLSPKRNAEQAPQGKRAYVIVYRENDLPSASDEEIINSLKAKYFTDELVVIVTNNPVEVILNESNN